MKGKLELKVMRVIQTGNLALLISDWSFNGTGADGKPVNLVSTATNVLHQQFDNTWRIIVDNPWGTDRSSHSYGPNLAMTYIEYA
jgi:ketosteroid isomerase-like protein